MYRPPPNSMGLVPAASAEELAEFVTKDETPGARTMFVGNLDTRVTRKMLYELMIQAGPVEAVRLVPPREGLTKTIAFVRFEHAASLRYALLIFDEVVLFRSPISLNFSGMHKGKPRPEHPPYPPTFFQLPPGLDDLSDITKQRLVEAEALPPSEYLSGYYVGNPIPEQTDEYLEQNHEHGAGEYSGYGHDGTRSRDSSAGRQEPYGSRVRRPDFAGSSARPQEPVRSFRHEQEYSAHEQYSVDREYHYYPGDPQSDQRYRNHQHQYGYEEPRYQQQNLDHHSHHGHYQQTGVRKRVKR